MTGNNETADNQNQSLEIKHSFLQRRWIPGRHSDSVILLEDFIKRNYCHDDYMITRFLVAVKGFDDSENVNSKQYDLFQRLLIILSSLTSLTIALEAYVVASNTLKIIALVFSLIVTILGNYMVSFNLQAKRGAYRFTRESLISEVYKFHEGIGVYKSSTDGAGKTTPADGAGKTTSTDGACKSVKKRLFVENVENIIKEANDNWGKLHQTQDNAVSSSSQKV
jgi:hypothetical protein